MTKASEVAQRCYVKSPSLACLLTLASLAEVLLRVKEHKTYTTEPHCQLSR